jgi:hypothetical protein
MAWTPVGVPESLLFSAIKKARTAAQGFNLATRFVFDLQTFVASRFGVAVACTVA